MKLDNNNTQNKNVIIANFMGTFENYDNNRFNYLYMKLIESKSDFELITSNFYHVSKKNRSKKKYPNIVQIDEPKYNKNVSIKRLFSHYVFSKNVYKYLKSLTYKPSRIYCAVPSIDVAYKTSMFAKKEGIELIIDIQDLWPEAFYMKLKYKKLVDFLFLNTKMKANYVYSNADKIIGVSDTYCDLALSHNRKNADAKTIYLGTTPSFFSAVPSERNENDVFRVCYVGTLGYSYDLLSVISAIDYLSNIISANIEFHIFGSGPREKEFKEFASRKRGVHVFHGHVKYEDMAKYISSNCHVAVNPIVLGSSATIINKAADYAAAWLPVINTQCSMEYRNLLKLYNAGVSCSLSDIAINLLYFYNNEEYRRVVSINSRKLFDENFNREITYQYILNLLGANNET